MRLYLGLVLCVWGTYAVLARKAIQQRNSRVLCLILASVLPAAYLLGMQSSGQIVYGGLLGDNSFQIALLNNVIHGNYFGDYYQKALPLDYPPLFFWVLGTLSRWLHLDAITAWRLFPVALLALWPFLFFQAGKKLGDEETAIWVCIGALGIGALNTRFFGFTLPQRDWGTFSLALNKPYEMLSAFFLLDWILECGIRQFALNKRNLFKTFVTGGSVALLYYPFLVPGAFTLILEYWREKSRIVRKNILQTGLVLLFGALLLGSLFWGMIVYGFLNFPHGANYRTDYIALWHFDPTGYTIGLGYGGGLFLFGLLTVWRLWKQDVKAPGYLLAGIYALVGVNFLTYPLFHFFWLPAKWMEFLVVFFGVLAGKGLKEFVEDRFHSRRVFILVLISVFIVPSPINWNVFTDPLNLFPGEQAGLLETSRQIATETEKVLDNGALLF